MMEHCNLAADNMTRMHTAMDYDVDTRLQEHVGGHKHIWRQLAAGQGSATSLDATWLSISAFEPV